MCYTKEKASYHTTHEKLYDGFTVSTGRADQAKCRWWEAILAATWMWMASCPTSFRSDVLPYWVMPSVSYRAYQNIPRLGDESITLCVRSSTVLHQSLAISLQFRRYPPYLRPAPCCLPGCANYPCSREIRRTYRAPEARANPWFTQLHALDLA